VDFENLNFLEPVYFKLLIIQAILFILLFWRFCLRRADVGRCLKERTVPLKEKYLFAGKLVFWSYLLLALSFSIVALTRPRSLISVSGHTSVDLVLVMDGSASMRVRDIKPDRWQRSMILIRNLIESLSWKGDRLALAMFASKAYPYIRLTSDPNVALFFVDHLKKESPLKLDDPKTWDTDIEEGIYWGFKILAKDYELYGASKNPQAFVLISDGQAWSGNMEMIFKIIKRVAPVYVIGVGTTVGGLIPEDNKPKTQNIPVGFDEEGNTTYETRPVKEEPPVHASIDRSSLKKIANTTGGEYFELGTVPDQEIINRIINSVKNRKAIPEKEESYEELYWWLMLGAAICISIGTFYLNK